MTTTGGLPGDVRATAVAVASRYLGITTAIAFRAEESETAALETAAAIVSNRVALSAMIVCNCRLCCCCLLRVAARWHRLRSGQRRGLGGRLFASPLLVARRSLAAAMRSSPICR